MTALAIGLAVLCAALASFSITQAIWLRRDGKDMNALREVLDASQADAKDFESRWRVETAAHAVTTDRLETEQHLRAIAEAQRNEAMRRVRELLGKHIKTATLEEIQEMTTDAFQSPLSLVPRSDGVPRAVSEGSDDLLNPFDPAAEVQPSRDP